MRIFRTLFALFFCLGLAASATAQCIPAAAATVAGTVPGAAGTYTFTNVPTGRVIQLTVPAANTVYAVSMCATNPGANVPSGTNDSYLTFLNVNGPAAVSQGTLDDGCANMAAPGYGPSFGNWTSPAAGTYFIYLTEYNLAGTDACVADGVNAAYDFSITVTPPAATDASLLRDALEYTFVMRDHILTSLPMTGVIGNVGAGAITGATVSVSVATAAAPGTPIFTGTSPATNVPAGGTANATAGNWTPPALTGAYIVTYAVSATGDANAANNTFSKRLYLTASNYGRDVTTLTGGLGINGTGLIRQGTQYTFLQGGNVSGCQYLIDGGQAGDTIQLEVYTIAAGVVSAAPVASGPVQTLAAAQPGLITLNLTTPLAVNNTTTYLFSLLHRSRNVNLGLGYSDSLFVQDRQWLKIGAGAWGNPEDFGFNAAYIARPQFQVCTNPTYTATYNCATDQIVVNVTNAGSPTAGATFTIEAGGQTQNLTGTGNYTFNLPNTQTYTIVVDDQVACATGEFIFPNCGAISPGCSNVINDGGFELAAGTAWTESLVDGTGAPLAFDIVFAQNPLTGLQSAWFGGIGAGGSVSTISQSVTAPANITVGELTFWYTFGTCDNATDFFTVTVNGTVAQTITANVAQCGSGDWYLATVDVAPFLNAGANIIQFQFTEGNANVGNTNFFVDNAALEICTCPTLTATVTTTNSICTAATGSATVTPAAGVAPYTFNWSNGATSQTANGLVAGTYTVTATDANGCTVSASATVAASQTVLTATTTTTAATCVNPGTAAVNVSGGAAPYTFSWSTGATTQSITAGAGTYFVTATDNNGCTGTGTATISNPAAPTATAVPNTITCFGGTNGAVTLNVTGGMMPYSFIWSNGATTQNLANLTAGTYISTITDANNCSFIVSAIVTQPSAIQLTGAVVTNVSCFGGNNGGIDITVAGGTPSYTYTWSNGATTQDIAGVAAGTFTGTITDANGCSASASAAITQPTAIALTGANITNVACFGGATGAIDITVAGGTAPYTYSWSNGATTQDIAGVVAGIYSGTITDANGCTASAAAPITQPAAALGIAGNPTIVNNACFGDCTGSITVPIGGGTAPYTYLWTNGATTAVITNLCAGNYNGVVTDANGCTFTSPVQIPITEPAALGATAVVTNTTGANDGAIDLTVTGGTAPYTYSWSNGATTQDISGLNVGSFTGTITDANGCSASASFNIILVGTELVEGINSLEMFPNPTNGNLNVTLDLTASHDLQVAIFTAAGQIVRTELVSNVRTYQQTFRLGELAEGVYFVRFTFDNQVVTRRFTIAK